MSTVFFLHKPSKTKMNWSLLQAARSVSLSSSKAFPSFTQIHGSSYHCVSYIHKDFVEIPRYRRFVCGFSSFSASQDLAIKKCVPCNSKDIQPLSEESANGLLPQIQGWNLTAEEGVMKLQRSWKVKSFTKGLEFFQLVADVAEAEGHHPDLHLVGWNNLKIDIWTHSAGGLTENDFILAAKINSLKVEHLLRKKASVQ